MAENLLHLVVDLLEANIPKQFEGFKDLLVKMFTLRFIENIGPLTNELQESLNHIKDKFNEELTEVATELLTKEISQIEKTFFKAILSPLELSQIDIERILEKIENQKSIKFLSLLELGFEQYLKKENSEQTCMQLFDKILMILGFYGFKSTNYITMSVLRFFEFSIKSDLISEKLGGEEFVPNLADDEISSEEFIQEYLEWILRKRKEFPPFNYLRGILESLEITISNVNSICKQVVNHFFLTIEEFDNHHHINSVVYKFDQEFEELSSTNLCNHGLNLQYLRPAKLGESPFYEKGFKYSINPYGFPESTRFCYDRIVLLGAFNGNYFQNDFFLDKSFMPQNLLMICGESGYYICDYSSFGLFGRKLKQDEKIKLEENTVFQLGPQLYIYVMNINTFEGNRIVVLGVIKGCGLRGAKYYAVFEGKNLIKVGRDHDNDVVINESNNNDKTISRKHCELVLEEGSVYLKDVKGSNGTYVNLKNYKEITYRVPSKFHLIDGQEDYLLNDVLFRFVPIN